MATPARDNKQSVNDDGVIVTAIIKKNSYDFDTLDDTEYDYYAETEEEKLIRLINEIDDLMRSVDTDVKFIWKNTISKYNQHILQDYDELSSSAFYKFILDNSPVVKKLIVERNKLVRAFTVLQNNEKKQA